MTNRKKKIALPGEVALLLGLLLNSLAVSLMIKSNFGISAISSVPYVLSVAFPVLSLGTWNALIQCVWLLLTMLVIRKWKPGYLFSFVLAFVFGLLLDRWAIILGSAATGIAGRVFIYMLAFGLMSIGISFFFLCGTPVLPFDTVPRAIVLEKGLSVSTARTAYDLINLVISLSVSLLFVGRVVGLGIGSVATALLMGTVVGRVSVVVQRHFDIKPRIKALSTLV